MFEPQECETDWFITLVLIGIFAGSLVIFGLAGVGVWWLAHGAPSGGTTKTVLIDCTESTPPLPHIGTAISCETTP